MSLNYKKAYEAFKKYEEKIREEYSAKGMLEDAIESICEFDKELFLSDCRYTRRNVSMCEFNFEDDHNPLIPKVYIESSKRSRYWWIDEIENEEISKRLRKLTLEEIDLITMYVFENLSMQKIANIFGVSKNAISKRFKNIKKIFNYF